jgi:hypothetical protein
MRLKKQLNPVVHYRWIHFIKYVLPLVVIPISCLLLILAFVMLINMSGIISWSMTRGSPNFISTASALFLLIMLYTGILLCLGLVAISIGEDLLQKRKTLLMRKKHLPQATGINGLMDIMSSLDDSIIKLKEASQSLSVQVQKLSRLSQKDNTVHEAPWR